MHYYKMHYKSFLLYVADVKHVIYPTDVLIINLNSVHKLSTQFFMKLH